MGEGVILQRVMGDRRTDGRKNRVIVTGDEGDGVRHREAAFKQIENHDKDVLRLGDEESGGRVRGVEERVELGTDVLRGAIVADDTGPRIDVMVYLVTAEGMVDPAKSRKVSIAPF